MDSITAPDSSSRVAALIITVAVLATVAGSQSAARTAATAEQPRTVDSQPPASDALRLAETRDLSPSQDGTGLVGGYDWPYQGFAHDYAHFAPRYRDYRRDYGNFAYDYIWFAPRNRDYVADYGEFATDYQPKRSNRLPEAPTGQVVIDVLPTSALVFIDGHYVGLSYELTAGFTLKAGPHRLEIRADDYESATLNMMIEPGRLSRYEGTLVRSTVEPERAPEPTVPERASPAMTIYFIPRCYLGNVPPTAARLPPGCDLKDLKVMPR